MPPPDDDPDERAALGPPLGRPAMPSTKDDEEGDDDPTTTELAKESGAAAERGMVTAESALGLIALVAVLALCLAAVQIMVAQLRTQEALRAAAREISRGATVGDAESAAERAVRGPVEVRVADAGRRGDAGTSGLRQVEVRRVVRPGMPRAPAMVLRASVVTAMEGDGARFDPGGSASDDPWP